MKRSKVRVSLFLDAALVERLKESGVPLSDAVRETLGGRYGGTSHPFVWRYEGRARDFVRALRCKGFSCIEIGDMLGSNRVQAWRWQRGLAEFPAHFGDRLRAVSVVYGVPGEFRKEFLPGMQYTFQEGKSS